jgi:hypothetical protein
MQVHGGLLRLLVLVLQLLAGGARLVALPGRCIRRGWVLRAARRAERGASVPGHQGGVVQASKASKAVQATQGWRLMQRGRVRAGGAQPGGAGRQEGRVRKKRIKRGRCRCRLAGARGVGHQQGVIQPGQ